MAETVQESKKALLNRSGKKSSRIIDEKSQNLSDIFGIDLDESSALPQTVTTPAGKSSDTPAKSRTKKAKPGRPKAVKVKDKSSRPAGTAKKTNSVRIKNAAGIETLFKRRTKRHTTVAEVIEKSDMAPQKVRNILSVLTKKGKLERVSRGIYRWVRPEPS